MTSDAQRFALIIASDTFEDPAFRALRAPAQDAAELARVLRPVSGCDQSVSSSPVSGADQVVRSA
jgi:hypothetical protein